MSKELPGYDSWLDNYGNPGLGDDEPPDYNSAEDQEPYLPPEAYAEGIGDSDGAGSFLLRELRARMGIGDV